MVSGAPPRAVQWRVRDVSNVETLRDDWFLSWGACGHTLRSLAASRLAVSNDEPDCVIGQCRRRALTRWPLTKAIATSNEPFAWSRRRAGIPIQEQIGDAEHPRSFPSFSPGPSLAAVDLEARIWLRQRGLLPNIGRSMGGLMVAHNVIIPSTPAQAYSSAVPYPIIGFRGSSNARIVPPSAADQGVGTNQLGGFGEIDPRERRADRGPGGPGTLATAEVGGRRCPLLHAGHRACRRSQTPTDPEGRVKRPAPRVGSPGAGVRVLGVAPGDPRRPGLHCREAARTLTNRRTRQGSLADDSTKEHRGFVAIIAVEGFERDRFELPWFDALVVLVGEVSRAYQSPATCQHKDIDVPDRPINAKTQLAEGSLQFACGGIIHCAKRAEVPSGPLRRERTASLKACGTIRTHRFSPARCTRRADRSWQPKPHPLLHPE